MTDEPDEPYEVVTCDGCGREVVGEYSECPYCGDEMYPLSH